MAAVTAPPPPQVAWLLQPMVKCPLSSWYQSLAILQSHPHLSAACITAPGEGPLSPTLGGPLVCGQSWSGVSDLFLTGAPASPSIARPPGPAPKSSEPPEATFCKAYWRSNLPPRFAERYWKPRERQ